MFKLSKDTELTLDLLQELLDEHNNEVEDFKKMRDAYESKHDILTAKAKPKYKPDNRIVVNFPKYIVDTTNGFFIGNPVKTTATEEAVAEYVNYLDQYNDQDDNNAELSKLCDIYGKGYEMYFTDEEAELCITYLTPIEAFMVFDDSIIERPLFFVRRYTDRDGTEWGSVSNSFGVRYFKATGGVSWLDPEEGKDERDGWTLHYFPGVPAVEYVENAEKQGLCQPIMTMVNAYNKAISEKANDVDYFADAYLKILGAKVENDDVQFIRDNRIVNFEGDDAAKIVAEFMGKPESDTAQENLLNRLERLIFQIGQTANVSDENFGTSSGIAILYKMWSTSNLGKTKERKFSSGMLRRYKLLFGHPASKVAANAWMQLKFKFTPNIPKNLLEETQIASNMEGITSHETQLEVISVVEDVQGELDKIKAEEEEARQKAEQISNGILGFGNNTGADQQNGNDAEDNK